MKGFLVVFFIGVLPLTLLGCSSTKSSYRDPVTYSFESKESASPQATEWHDLKGKAEETSKKIRSVEEKYLW